jgi:predicted methyltransferase
LESTASAIAEARGHVSADEVAHALALLDEGRVAEAQALLARALARAELSAPPGVALPSLVDEELEQALDGARPETDSMIDADGIAFEAIRRARLDEPETVALPIPGSPFHTRTLADLLERQGDAEGAQAIRSSLESDAGPADGDSEQRAQTIRILERWLARLRGGEA